MIIKKTRIRNLDLYLPGVTQGTSLIIALTELGPHKTRIEQGGLSFPLVSGESVLPTVRGPISRFNAEGKEIIHRDQAKEQVYHQREWTHPEWHGDQQVEVTKLYDIPYERYPRTFVPPPAFEFRAATTTDGNSVLVTRPVVYQGSADSQTLHAINLFLEYFGECDVLNAHLDSIINVSIKRLNWEVLPAGARPWDELRPMLSARIGNFDSGKNAAFRGRLDHVNSFGPTFAAVGNAGFQGYVVFGFPSKGMTFCESIYRHNATYVFDNQWEDVVKLTKTEVLDQNLHKHRLIHMPGWQERVSELLG